MCLKFQRKGRRETCVQVTDKNEKKVSFGSEIAVDSSCHEAWIASDLDDEKCKNQFELLEESLQAHATKGCIYL